MTNKFFRKIFIDEESKNSDKYVKQIENIMFAMIYTRFNIDYILFKFNQFINNFKKFTMLLLNKHLNIFDQRFNFA